MPDAVQPGMVAVAPRTHEREPALLELSRVTPSPGRRALLVVHPRTACSGSASLVLLDADGAFVGALPPGTAALLDVGAAQRSLMAVSSVELAAPVRTWSAFAEVAVPPPPSGLVVRTRRWDARECGGGQYADVVTATKAELEAVLAEAEIRWLAARPAEGQAWLDAHRARVRELVARGPSDDPRAR